MDNLDALDFIKKLEDESVDLVLTDPPYNVSRDNNLKTMGRGGLDFGEWDKGFDVSEWLEAISPKVKKGGSIVFFNAWRNLPLMSETVEKNGFEVKDLIRWVKSNPMPRNRDRRYIVDFELAVWAVKKGGKWTFNRLNETYDRPQYEYAAPNGKMRIHPTQKPVPLLEEIIKRHSDPGDLIVDPFAGSGSVAIACLNQERLYKVNDADPVMVEKAKGWIREKRKEKAISDVGGNLKEVYEWLS